MALSDYDKQYLSANQQAQIQNLTNQWNELDKQEAAARAAGDQALSEQIRAQKANLNTQAEAIRASAGYLGGQSGTGYTPIETPEKQQATNTPSYNVPTYDVPTYDVPAYEFPVFDFSSFVQDNSSYLEEMYAAQKAAALSSIRAAYEENTAAIDRAGAGIAEGYRSARNETAGASELAKRNNAQYAAAHGLNSGTGGQMELARNITLQNNLNAINTSKGQSMADLALQRAQAETEYNAAIAQAEYTGEYELAATLYEEKVRVQEALLEAEIRQQQYALEQYQLQYQAQRDSVADQKYQDSLALQQAEQALKEWQAQAEQALAQQKHNDAQASAQRKLLAEYGEQLLKAGVMPTAEMREAMGMTEEDARRYIAALKASQK